MTSSNNSSLPPSEKNPWRFWERSRLWQDDLYKQAAHKALDIPNDMGDIQANRTVHNHGFGLGSLLAIAGGTALLGSGFGAAAAIGIPLLMKLFDREPSPAPPQPPAVEIPAGTDTFNRIKPLPGE